MTPDSAYHIDIIRNDWARATQRLVARVEMNGELVVKDSVDELRWTEILLGPARADESGALHEASEGKAYLELLIDAYERDPFYDVTPMHTDSDGCPFAGGLREIPMRTGVQRQQTSA